MGEIKEKQLITDLIQITKVIETIYQKLAQAEFVQDENSYQEQMENLWMCLEFENEIYQKLTPAQKQVLQKKDILLTNINSQIGNSNSQVKDRLSNYLPEQYLLNPFLSLEQNPLLNQKENVESIMVQYTLDVFSRIICRIEEKIIQTKSKKLKKSLISLKYDLIFKNKVLENFFLTKNGITPIILNRKDVCRLYHQENSLVEEVYDNVLFAVLDLRVTDIIDFDQITFKNQIEKETELILMNIDFEIALSLLTKESFYYFYNLYNFDWIVVPTVKQKKRIDKMNEIVQRTITENHY